jgi:ABC-type glutathione transport system ATPase component
MTHPLEVSSLSKSFETSAGFFLAVKDFSVKIASGEFVSIVGRTATGNDRWSLY